MKTTKEKILCAGLGLVAGLMILPMTCNARGMGMGRGAGQGAGLSVSIDSLPYQELSSAEESGLLKMREEEKLARDVYQALFAKWGISVFSNIGASEQRHMDAVKALLDKYDRQDPVTDPTPGVFTDHELQQLYNTLVEQGSATMLAALQVGATIEDLDIKDLYDLLAQTDNTDIQFVYQNLVKGSRNHLRAFVSLLTANGDTYEAQFLSQEQIDAIVSSPKERGWVDADGNPVFGGGSGRGQRGRIGTQNGVRMLLTK